jgi:hypothetical protein
MLSFMMVLRRVVDELTARAAILYMDLEQRSPNKNFELFLTLKIKPLDCYSVNSIVETQFQDISNRKLRC